MVDAPVPDEPEIETGDWKPREARAMTTLLVGRVVQDDGVDDLCRVRNISAGGMMLETKRGLSVGHDISLELRNSGALDGRVVWTKPGHAGIQFPQPINVEQVLSMSARNPAMRTGLKPRAPRFETRCLVYLRVDRLRMRSVLLNLSQSGARIELPEELPIGDRVALSIPGVEPRDCAVRWQQGTEAGLAFYNLLSFAELSDWLTDNVRRFSAE